MKVAIDVCRLKCLLHYNPYTGIFKWVSKPNRRIPIGSVAGVESKKRIQIRIDGKVYRAHRLAWLYMYGSWPSYEIDHKNGDSTDNRIDNLRDVPHQLNLQNKKRANKSSSTGIPGVTKATNQNRGYRARINKFHLGTFETISEARSAYLDAKRKTHPGYIEDAKCV